MTKRPAAYTQPSVLTRIASGEDWNSYIWGERDETDEAFNLAIPHPENGVPLYTLSDDELARLDAAEAASSAIRPEMVKPLQWTIAPLDAFTANGINVKTAYTSVGCYQVQSLMIGSPAVEQWFVRLNGGYEFQRNPHAAETLAIDSAQADYAARIISAIDPEFLARIEALEAENAVAYAKLTCMCGSYVADHSMDCGHSPVSQYDHSMDMSHRVIADIEAERFHQICEEGWTFAHDDKYIKGEMASAAACYAHHATRSDHVRAHNHGWPRDWPWLRRWWKPTDRRRDLIKAGALIVAEIERIDRARAALTQSGGQTDADE